MKRRYRWRININGFHKKDLDSATFRGWPHIDSRDEEKWEEYTCLTKMKLHLIFVFIFFGAVAGAGIRGNDGNITHISSHPSIDEEADYIVKPAQVDVDPLEVDQGPPDVKHDGFQDDDELHEADQERELSWRRKKGKSYKSKYYHNKRKQKKYYYHDYYDYRKKHKKRKKYKKYYHKKYKPYYRKKKYGYYYYH